METDCNHKFTSIENLLVQKKFDSDAIYNELQSINNQMLDIEIKNAYILEPYFLEFIKKSTSGNIDSHLKAQKLLDSERNKLYQQAEELNLKIRQAIQNGTSAEIYRKENEAIKFRQAELIKKSSQYIENADTLIEQSSNVITSINKRIDDYNVKLQGEVKGFKTQVKISKFIVKFLIFFIALIIALLLDILPNPKDFKFNKGNTYDILIFLGLFLVSYFLIEPIQSVVGNFIQKKALKNHIVQLKNDCEKAKIKLADSCNSVGMKLSELGPLINEFSALKFRND